MRTIFLEHPHQLKTDHLPPSVMALGYFDGVHLGHQRVIQTAIQIAEQNNMRAAVMTFDPHPAVVLGRKKDSSLLTPLSIKEKRIKALGVDILYVVKFDLDFSKLSPQQFVDDYIIGLSVKHVVAGFDYTFGRFGAGTMETIGNYSRGQFDHTIVEKVEKNGVKISSSAIREEIKAGRVAELPEYLGRYYQLEGTVVSGEKRGRTIGFPTANIVLNGDFLLPKEGVYAARLLVDGKWHNGVLNLGYKPTFHDRLEEAVIEVHLFDFDENIYGENVTLEWRKRLRGEKKFSSVDALTKQINADKEEAQRYFHLQFR